VHDIYRDDMSIRTPDPKLVGNRSAMESLLRDLTTRAVTLETDIGIDNGDMEVSPKWRGVLDSFRVLTISATASGPSSAPPSFLVSLYESATRAALFAGDLELFNLFRSRLVRDVYPTTTSDNSFISKQPLEVSMILRRNSISTSQSPSTSMASSKPFIFALRAAQAEYRQDGLQFLRLYNEASVLPKALLSFSLPEMKAVAYRAIIRSYMKIEALYAEALFDTDRRSIFEAVVAEDERLSAVNTDFSASVINLRPKRST